MTLASRFDTTASAPAPRQEQGGVVLGEDWVNPEGASDPALRADRKKRSIVSPNRSPLARKIVVFNLLALVVLVAGVLFLNPSRDSLVLQREAGLVTEARLIASAVEARLPQTAGPMQDAPTQEAVAALTLARIEVAPGTELFIYDRTGTLIASTVGRPRADVPPAVLPPVSRNTYLTDLLSAAWDSVSRLMPGQSSPGQGFDSATLAQGLVETARHGNTTVRSGQDAQGATLFSVATPILRDGGVLGVVAVTSAAGELDLLVRNEREQVLRMFIVALLVSIALSLVLASTIANPLSDLAAAAELGRDRNARKMAPGRIRIPDLTARPDEIGRLSGALRGMVAALYDRIEANEQFAADVAHEIKNPLASLRSAVGSLRMVRKDEQRERLLDVLEHDVRRLDRLVSDISNASRLDSELVKEEQEEFNLIRTLNNINQHLAQQAAEKGVDYITDLPAEPILIHGLEERLAQVFVNLITNAISFCDEGDAVRVWARRRDNRVLIVVEDTGPGIPEQALTKIFKRFYSDRPATHFGNNSGLGLSISKQIVEAHAGVIWAENIRPTDDDATSDPLGARFVVGLPV
ncbi:two-component system, OmpR family, sensor histidine kinase ChvG [Gemmobacter megaterium]|uniref:histidine kinase n=1 Tax=Gemmobacter megaterium TaxID=1086013 RepID=A0A1N7M1Y8_9RHOB|nr:sensor N-terminal transmembrane domain-containing protein [Gemmobacter megaterium]GGE09275.1 sensor histidine kinase [Gemmobacter megaterium]SIS80098.1 two-component system, OmpR family, sensor histidine kinase ChvG [Gemmobacter megaterium]